MNINPRDMDVFEILDEVVKIKSDNNKVELIQTKFRDHQPLRYMVKMNYCDSIVPLLPEGEPPFNKEEIDGPSRQNLWTYLQSMIRFVQGPQAGNMSMLKRESLFIEMLENLEIKEAEMVCLAKDKKLETKWPIDISVWQRAFPDLYIQRVQNAS